ncbi:hypothetical protein BDV06DRAFT_213919 [Aspergillus oleicola]
MAFGTIYSYPYNPWVFKFLSKFPLSKAPIFKSTNSVNLFKSNIIIYYIIKSGPATFSKTKVTNYIITTFLPCFGLVPYNKEMDNKGFMFFVNTKIRAKYPVVITWWKRVTESKSVKEAFGETKFIKKREIPAKK